MTDPNNPFAVASMPAGFPTVPTQQAAPQGAPAFQANPVPPTGGYPQGFPGQPQPQGPSGAPQMPAQYAPPAPAPAPQGGMMMAPPGTFAGIEGVDPAQSRYPFFTGIDGTHRCEIVTCKFVNSDGNQFFVVDFRINESTNPNAQKGEIRTWMEQLNSKYRETTMKTIKAFLAAANGVETTNTAALASIGDEYVRHVISPANPLASKTLDVRAVTSPQKADPSKDYTKHYFSIMGREPLVVQADVAASFAAPVHAPAPPSMPQAPAQAAPVAFPPAPWQAHPQNPAYFWKVGFPTPVTEQDLRTLMAQGKA